MKRRFDPPDWEGLRDKVIGLGDQSHRKSHYSLLQERLAELERFRILLDASDEIILVVDSESGTIVDANGGACRRLKHAKESLLGQPLERFCELSGSQLVGLLKDEPSAGHQISVAIHDKAGATFPAEGSAALRTVGGESFLSLVVRDVSERLQAEEALHNLAFLDSLTGLPNRRLLVDRLQHSMAASARSQKYRALLFLDLDHFKNLNDTQGHDVGDRLLREVATRLHFCVREGDTVSRLGGDEFVVLLEQLSPEQDEAVMQAGAIIDKIVASLGKPYDLGAKTHYRGTASVGVVMFLGHAVPLDELLKRADLAMYQAKAAGRNTLRFFDPAMQASINARTEMENDLRRALADSEFVLHYQPQMDGAGRCIGVEALIRWQSPVHGLVPPMNFIPLAEETGLILPIGEWVLAEACRQLAAWQNDSHAARLSVAVNVSALQFRQPGFVDEVRRLVRAHGVDPSRLKLEITESMLVKDVEDVIAKMLALKELGVGFSLDDFGTGYSSLSYVKRLPLDQLKIDKSFVRDVLIDPNDAAICRAVIGLGRSLGLKTIAEGVEDHRQWAFLAAEGCNGAQGYLYARPMPCGQLHDWLAQHP